MKKILILIFIILFAVFAYKPIIHYSTMDTITDTIVAKERVTTLDDSFYTISGKNEVYRNSDTIWAFKYNSSDVQRDAIIGSECTLKVTGFRVPFFSMYRNIIGIVCKQ